MTTPHLKPVSSQEDVGDVLRALRESLTETPPDVSSDPSTDVAAIDEASPRDLERDVRAMIDAWIEQVRRELDESLAEARRLTRARAVAPDRVEEARTIPVPVVDAIPVVDASLVVDVIPVVETGPDEPRPQPASPATDRQVRRVLASLALPMLAVVLFVAALLSWIG